MRILVVTNLYPPQVRGGYEIECHDAVEHLRRSHDVEVLTSGGAGPAREPGVHRTLPIVEESRAGVVKAPLATVRARRVVTDVLARHRPDLVFLWNGAGIPYSAVHALLASGHPIAVRVCEQWIGGLFVDDMFARYLSGAQRDAHPVWSGLVRGLNRLPGYRIAPHRPVAAAVSWNSEFLRGAVRLPPMLTAVLEDVTHPVTEASTSLVGCERRPDPADPQLLFVGRLSAEKGVDVAIRAVAELRRRGTTARLQVVGGGEARFVEGLRALARRESVDDLVHLTGPLSGPDLRAEVTRASVWVVPSTWDEPAGMVALEAALARVPLVASRVGGIPELLRDEAEALLFERGSVAGCADALARALAGDADGAARADRAFARAHAIAADYPRRIEEFVAAAATSMT